MIIKMHDGSHLDLTKVVRISGVHVGKDIELENEPIHRYCTYRIDLVSGKQICRTVKALDDGAMLLAELDDLLSQWKQSQIPSISRVRSIPKSLRDKFIDDSKDKPE